MKALIAAATLSLMAALPVRASAPRIDASMLLSGHITVTRSGAVHSYTIEHANRVPGVVRDLLRKVIPRWRFVPMSVDGQPVAARSSMTLRVVARPIANHRYNVRVEGVTFGNGRQGTDETFRVLRRQRPIYPQLARREGVTGTVYLVLQLDRQGHVERAAAEQVNLRVRGPERLMQHWRDMLSQSALGAARHWVYRVPSRGPLAHQDHWVVRVPVTYRIRHASVPPRSRYGQWVSYMPGPHRTIGWLKPDQRESGAADALPDGGIAAAGSGLRRIVKPHS